MTAPPAPAEHLDLRGVRCPTNAARALVRLEAMAPDEVLELLLDDGEPIASVPASLHEQGHRVLTQERAGPAWRLLVRAGG
jgi:TusA-related sulfurtransferase